ncbi:MAG: hypothetical protein ACYC26_15460 [Phycisphaerales bacterium]
MNGSVFTMTFTKYLAALLIGWSVGAAAWAMDVPLDLSKVVNRDFVDQTAGDGKGGWSDQGPTNCLTRIKPGAMDADGVPFDILDAKQHDGRAVAVFNSANCPTNLKEMTLTVPQDQPAQVRALYLLHTLVWGGGDRPFGTIRVNYSAGQPVTFDLKVGVDAADWWGPHNVPNGRVAYTEINGESKVGLYLSRFELPADRGRPQSFTLTTTGGPTWIVAAATASDAWRPAPTVDSGPWVVKADAHWKPFDQSDPLVRSGTALDMSFLVEPGPAGRHGAVIINDRGQLAFADQPQQPVRFLCTAWGMDVPDVTQIDVFAEQIKRGGYNAYRPHYLDAFLMQDSQQDLVFNPIHLDQWDRLSAALKKRGIYLAMDLTSSQTMFHHEMPWTPDGKALDSQTRMYFDPAAQEHWKQGVRMLLEHVNPYTGVALKNEPQVIYMALRNEPGLQFQAQWFWRRQQADGPTGRMVLDHFRHWLEKQYGDTEALAKAWTVVEENGVTRRYLKPGRTFQTVSPPPLYGRGPDTRDLMRFFLETEQNTFAWMSKYLREEVGVKVPLNDYNNTVTAEAIFARNSIPLIDIHGYHDHPTDYKSPGSRQSNHSLIAADADILCRLASVRQWGKPMICTEWGQPFWNSWRREAGLVFPSYAALQGWQLLTQHAWNVAISVNEPITPFRVGYDPVLRSADLMAALLFARGDVATSPHLAEIRLDGSAVFDKGLAALGIPGPLTRLAMISGLGVKITGIADASPATPFHPDLTLNPTGGDMLVRVAGAEQAITQNVDRGSIQSLQNAVDALRRSGTLTTNNKTDVSAGIFQSDTGQLLLDRDKKLMTVVTPRSQGAVLARKDQTVVLDRLTLTSHDAPAAVLVSSLTDQPIEHGNRLLMLVATDALNTDMTFTDHTRTELVEIGRLPVLLRTAKLTISLQHDHPDQLTLWALAPNGTRTEQIPLKIQGDRVIAVIDTATLLSGPTPYFEWIAK